MVLSLTQVVGAMDWSQFFSGASLALLGGVFAAILAGIGSAKGVGLVGSVAAGTLSEKPELFGKLIILQALPGTQGIYGLLVWFFIMNFAGFFDGTAASISVSQGILYFLACLPMAIVGYYSAKDQARVAADGVSLVAKNPGEQSKAIILSAMVETYAIFALLVSVLSIIMISNMN